MSEINELWNSAKKGLEKSAANPLALIGAAEHMLPALRNAGKAGGKELSTVAHNIEEAIPTMKTVTGPNWTVNPKGLPGPAAAEAAAPAAAKGLLGRTGDSLKGLWGGLSPAARGGIKATGLLGTGALAGHARGEATGTREGLALGADMGFDEGLRAGASRGSADPGALGRLLEVFTGRQPTSIDPADQEIAARRQMALRRILAGH